MNDLALPINLPPEIWHVMVAICATVIVFVWINMRIRVRNYDHCRMCHHLHETRPSEMSAYDFWLLYCRKEKTC